MYLRYTKTILVHVKGEECDTTSVAPLEVLLWYASLSDATHPAHCPFNQLCTNWYRYLRCGNAASLLEKEARWGFGYTSNRHSTTITDSESRLSPIVTLICGWIGLVVISSMLHCAAARLSLLIRAAAAGNEVDELWGRSKTVKTRGTAEYQVTTSDIYHN